MSTNIVVSALRIVRFVFPVVLGLMACEVSGVEVDGDLQLRDAIYLYDQPIKSWNYYEITGSNCDVLQLVLDLDSGYSDIWTSQGIQQYVLYADTIRDRDPMFAYALYGSDRLKSFTLSSRARTTPEVEIGRATVFGYCYSTKTNAYVYKWRQEDNTCTYSNGFVEQNCM